MEDKERNYLQRLMEKMETKKDEIFGNRIKIFNYYVFGEAYDEKNLEQIAPYLPGQNAKIFNFNVKSDNTAQSIVEIAQGMYVSALLPKGTSSIKIVDESIPMEATSEKNQLAELSKRLRLFLESPELSFNHSFYSAVGDYLNYGNCLIRILEGGKCVYIPFKNVWFYTEYLSQSMIMMYKVDYLPETIEPFLQRFFGTEGVTYLQDRETIEIHHLFVQEDSSIKEYAVHKETNSYVLLATHSKDTFPVFVAREIKQNQVYGMGSGITAITNIYNANVFTTATVTETKKGILPASLIPSDSELNKELDSTFHNQFVSYPGFTNIEHAPTTSTQKIQLFPSIPQAIEIYRSTLDQMYMQIERSYNVDIFKLATESPRTATEIIERKNVAIRVFNGKSAPFYNELLYPLLNYILKKYVEPAYIESLKEQKMRYLLKNPKVYIESFSNEQQKEVELLELQASLQLAGALPEQVQGALAEGGFYGNVIQRLNKILTI